jgi:hypothetical protein
MGVEMPNPTGQGLKPIQKGERRPGAGRPSGAPNRFPQELKQAMLDAASEVGSSDRWFCCPGLRPPAALLKAIGRW